MDELVSASQAMATRLYQQAAQQQAAAGGADGETTEDDDVVEAEIVDEDE
jgi:molecular chaperone DnaK